MEFDAVAVAEPSPNDVLCGRGGSINSHAGNERFRQLVEKRKRVYLTARFKREKRLIASSIVQEIRAEKGRFLSRDATTGLWKDIGDEKARDKTSQALRENAPTIRAEIETEVNAQRAEMRREEDAARASQPPSYYPPPSSWGYPGYYAYGHPPHGAPPPPPPPHAVHPAAPAPGAYYDPQWGGQAPPPPQQSYYPPQKSPYEAATDFVTSGAESVKSFFGGRTQDELQAASTEESVRSKPLSYVHGESRKRTRFSPSTDSVRYDGHSLLDGELEPVDINEPVTEAETSLMHQFANNVMGTLGKWDTSTFCGIDQDDRRFFPQTQQAPEPHHEHEDDMAVEWEGQEVQLLDDRDTAPAERMPPPSRRPMDPATSVGGFSSLGSCHTWDHIAGTLFGHRNEAVAPAHSMDMGQSMNGSIAYSMNGSVGQSMNGSIGGASLAQVFDNGSISHLPSWERRPRSPDHDDDISLVSKGSSKFSLPLASDSMTWGSKE